MQTGDPFDGVSDRTHLLTDLVDSETSYVERRNGRAGLSLRHVPPPRPQGTIFDPCNEK